MSPVCEYVWQHYMRWILMHAMMTSSNGNIFRVTGPLWQDSIGHWWIPLTKVSDEELWCFLYVRLNKRLSKQTRCRWFDRRHGAHNGVTVIHTEIFTPLYFAHTMWLLSTYAFHPLIGRYRLSRSVICGYPSMELRDTFTKTKMSIAKKLTRQN